MNCKYFEFNFKGHCYSCPPGCSKCSSEALCLECHSNALEVIDSKCKQTFKNRCTLEASNNTQGYLNNNGKCEPCHYNCSNCFGFGNNQCLSCDQSSILEGSTCIKKGTDNDQVCGSGKILNLNNMCDSCPQNCLKCTANQANFTILNDFKFTEYACNICKPDYFLDRGKCVENCPEGASSQNGKCTPNPSNNPLTCIGDSNLCKSDPNNYKLEQTILGVILGILIITTILGIIILRNYRVLSRKCRTLRINQMMPRKQRATSIELLNNGSLSNANSNNGDKTQFAPIQQLETAVPANRAKCYNLSNNKYQ